MPRNITVTFSDGTTHVYRNAPDEITPDDVLARAQRDFGIQPTGIDGGKRAVAAFPDQQHDTATNIGMGAVKGLADVGRTIINTGAKLLPQSMQDDLHAAQTKADAALPNHTDVDSGTFRAGRVAGNVAGTYGPTKLVAGGLRLIPGAAKLATATETGGLGAQEGGLATRMAGGAVSGATQGALVDPSSRSALEGGAIGALIPPVARAGSTLADLVPLGTRAAAGNILRKSIRGNPDEVVANLRNAQEVVPGSGVNTAEASGDLGIANLRNAVLTKDPMERVNALAEDFNKNAARTDYLTKTSGLPSDIEAAKAARSEAVDPLYKQAYGDAVKFTPELQSILTRPSMKAALGKAKKLAAEDGVDLADNSVGLLHYAKMALDDQIAGAAQTGMGPTQKRMLVRTQKDLLDAIDQSSPAYAKARATFQEMSKPINQMEALQDVVKRAQTGTFDDAGNAILSGPTLNNILKNEGKDLAKVLTPEQMQALRNVQADLNASSLVKRAGAAPIGSNTAANTEAVRQLNRLAGENKSPVPFVGNTLDWLAKNKADKTTAALIEALRNPQNAADLIAAARRKAIAEKGMGEVFRTLPAIAPNGAPILGGPAQ